MHSYPSMGQLVRRLGLVAMLVACSAPAPKAQNAKDRALRNSWEVHKELEIPQEAVAAVKDHFLPFIEYHDLVMFHPKFGYYASGRVSFTDDYRTFPIVMAPVFGHMVAEQMFMMWDGMRQAGTLNATERFTVAEFGPGDGVLAESILDYVQQKSKGDARWKQLASQLLYVCYDRSPSLNETQRKRNARFGSMFAARVADATNPTAAIPAGSAKGVVLSNELPDAFSVHKIILSADGTAEVAFVAPSLPAATWQTVRPLVPAAVAKTVESDDAAIEKRFFGGAASPAIHLSRGSFVALLENLITTKEYENAANALEFQEIYVPVSVIPELAAHVRRYAPVYAGVLARNPRGLVTYINLGAESFIQGSGQLLKAGYVLTLDYGSTWDGILAQDSYPHFRTYGPAHREANQFVAQDAAAVSSTVDTSQPYSGPTLNDMTTDVNFSLLAAEGQLVGLKPLFFGSQKALQTGTGISLANAPSNRPSGVTEGDFFSWAQNFVVPSVYKMFVQQKDGTDPAYRFPDTDPEPLELDQSSLTAEQRTRAAEIEQRLKR